MSKSKEEKELLKKLKKTAVNFHNKVVKTNSVNFNVIKHVRVSV